MDDNQLNESMAKDLSEYQEKQMVPTNHERDVLFQVLDTWMHQRVKGFDLDHDLKHPDGELSLAAASYAASLPQLWPWTDGWYKPKDRRTNLLRATAFLLSEIVRLDAAAEDAELFAKGT